MGESDGFRECDKVVKNPIGEFPGTQDAGWEVRKSRKHFLNHLQIDVNLLTVIFSLFLLKAISPVEHRKSFACIVSLIFT